MNIRKFVVRATHLEDLVQLGTLSAQAAVFLDGAVTAGLNILVAGGTQAGKNDIAQLPGGGDSLAGTDRHLRGGLRAAQPSHVADVVDGQQQVSAEQALIDALGVVTRCGSRPRDRPSQPIAGFRSGRTGPDQVGFGRAACLRGRTGIPGGVLAEVHGKVNLDSTLLPDRLEDTLTDAVFSALWYLPRRSVLRVLMEVLPDVRLSEGVDAAKVLFWPKMPSALRRGRGIEPDVVVVAGRHVVVLGGEVRVRLLPGHILLPRHSFGDLRRRLLLALLPRHGRTNFPGPQRCAMATEDEKRRARRRCYCCRRASRMACVAVLGVCRRHAVHVVVDQRYRGHRLGEEPAGVAGAQMHG